MQLVCCWRKYIKHVICTEAQTCCTLLAETSKQWHCKIPGDLLATKTNICFEIGVSWRHGSLRLMPQSATKPAADCDTTSHWTALRCLTQSFSQPRCCCMQCSYQRELDTAAQSWLSYPRGSVVVKVPCYKPDGRGLDTRWGDFFF
jgi:hypothetical protein